MRTIKFRGLSIHSNEWKYGSLLKIGDNYHILGDNDMYEDGHHIRQESDFPTWVDPNTVGQFTSLYDKNKKEIYEGDILKVQGTQERIEVRFVRGVFAFLWNGNLDDEAPINAPTQEWAEVIGNIHNNPKLLNRKK